MITVEYRDQEPYYTVRDRYQLIVIYTRSYSVARDFEWFVSRGHTARTLLLLARKNQLVSRAKRMKAPL